MKGRSYLASGSFSSGRYIYNIDEKAYWITYPTGEEVVILTKIIEIYVRVPENRLSLTVVEYIYTDGHAIPPAVIIPSTNIIIF